MFQHKRINENGMNISHMSKNTNDRAIYKGSSRYNETFSEEEKEIKISKKVQNKFNSSNINNIQLMKQNGYVQSIKDQIIYEEQSDIKKINDLKNVESDQ